jgi:hypothetical protein
LPPASDGRQETLAQANELSRSFAALLDSFNRHRGKGQQKGTVENVHLQAGGQAGPLERPEGGYPEFIVF